MSLRLHLPLIIVLPDAEEAVLKFLLLSLLFIYV